MKLHPLALTKVPALVTLALAVSASAADSGAAARPPEELRVVATVPDLADMAEQIGGDLVRVKCITTGREDMHFVPAKPSYLLLLNRADVLLEMGLDMEHAWLPPLLYECRNDRIQPGAPGFVNCSAGVQAVEIPGQIDRAEGEVHPGGNPHYNVAPTNGRLMAETVCAGLCQAAPNHANAFRENLRRYLDRFDSKLAEWEVLARPLRGTKVITYHRSWSYFARAFGLEVVGEVELKPGLAPTPSHIVKLVGKIRQHNVPVLIKEPYYSDEYPRYLSEKTGITVVNLPNMSGGTPAVEGYFNFIEYNIRTLLKALGKPVASAAEIERQLQTGGASQH